MKADPRFSSQPKTFWANVRLISQEVGYTERGKGRIKVPSLKDSIKAFEALGLDVSSLIDHGGEPTALGSSLVEYFNYRAAVLNEYVEPRLMDVGRARSVFEDLMAELDPKAPIPMNKQKGDKKAPAYFTGIVNMLVEQAIGEHSCDFNPRKLTSVTRDGKPVRTLARWIDGAFPGVINPVAIWEIKEYYYTTTFGSRVADSVYESLLDGLELEELAEHEGVDVLHYLMVDAHFTWWVKGKSYLCRMIDILNMGYVDEVLFGYEVVERLPGIAGSWPSLLE